MSFVTIIWSWVVHSNPFDISSDGFLMFQLLLLFMFKYAMHCHVGNFDFKKVAILGLIQIWECVLN